MKDFMEDIPGPPSPLRAGTGAHCESEIPNRSHRYVSLLIVLAAISTTVVIRSRA